MNLWEIVCQYFKSQQQKACFCVLFPKVICIICIFPLFEYADNEHWLLSHIKVSSAWYRPKQTAKTIMF